MTFGRWRTIGTILVIIVFVSLFFLALGNMWALVTCVVAYTLLAIGSWFFSICPYCGHRLGIALFVKRCPECGEELVYYY